MRALREEEDVVAALLTTLENAIVESNCDSDGELADGAAEAIDELATELVGQLEAFVEERRAREEEAAAKSRAVAAQSAFRRRPNGGAQAFGPRPIGAPAA